MQELREYFYLFWATETRAHPRTRVLPAAASESAPNGYPFFPLFFYCGLCPPFSEFFYDIMNTYGFRLLDFTPNAVLTMAVFAHLCENFVGVHPSVALFPKMSGKLILEHLWGRRTGPLSVRRGGGDRTKSRSRRSTRAVYPASELSGEITLLLLLV